MTRNNVFFASVIAAAVLWVATWVIRSRFEHDLALAAERSAQGSTVVATRCGPIEYQAAGEGIPLLMIHGSGGGHDQGMAWARPLAQQGVRVIAMSRFGYLRTPRPADASPEAQADAHICLLDALGIARAAAMGVSAGGPSAMQTAIRHPDRVSALVLVVPIAYKPGTVADSAPPASDDKDALLLRLLGSDFLFWTGLHVARDQLIRHVLATPPELVAAASEPERARVNDMAERILPVSRRAAGLRDDTRLGKRLGPYALESIRVPTLVVSARDDGFGTYAAAQYTASRIPGAKFLGFDDGGHLLVGHDGAVRAEILKLLAATVQPIAAQAGTRSLFDRSPAPGVR
jgi:2-hydroxy-6-oxonona-2,4-dienedioate hydrolase